MSRLTAFVGVLKNKHSGEIQNMEPAQKTEIGPMSPQMNDDLDNYEEYSGPSVIQN